MAVIGDAYIAVHAMTDGFQRSVKNSVRGIEREFTDAGSRASSSFSKALSGGSGNLSSFKKEALAANDAFYKMVTTGYFLGPAIAVAVGAISSLVSGLVAFVAQVGSAVPALMSLVGVFTAIGLAAITAKLAFSGIGKAVSALSKQKTSGGGADNSKQIETAEKSLARVLETNREALARADKNLAQAEDRLTEARKRATESLQQLNFDAEDAAIAEKRAAIELERARETLARVQDLPPNTRARREAELAYAEADLNLRRAKDRNSDLAKETEEANKVGVEGSKEVLNATEALQAAVDDKAKTERDAIRSQIDAEKALADAKKGSGAGSSAEDSALANLSEEAKAFAKYLVSIKGETQKLKNAAGKELFPQLTYAIQNLIDKLFPVLIPLFEKMGGVLGKISLKFSEVVTEASNLTELTKIGDTSVSVMETLGDVFTNLYDVMLSLLTAADPLIRRFADWIKTVTDGWKETLEAKNKTGELSDMFTKAGDAAAQIGRVLGNLFGAIMNIGEAASGPGSGGQKLMDTFEQSTAKFEEFTQKLLDDGSLAKFFNGVAENTEKISSLIVEIVKEFLKLGDDPSIGQVADGLSNVPGIIGQISEVLADAGPKLGEFFEQVVLLIQKFTESGSINTFFSILIEVLEVLNAIFGNEVVQKILIFTGPIMGAVKAFMFMNRVGGFAAKVVFGYGQKAYDAYKLSKDLAKGLWNGAKNFGKFLKSGKLASAATKVWTGIQAAFNAVMALNPIALVVLAIVALIAIVVIMYFKFKWFRDFVQKVWEAIKDAAEAVWKALQAGIEWVWNEIIKPVFEAMQSTFEAVWGAIKAYYEFVWDAITGAISFVWENIIKPVFKAMQTVFEEVWGAIQAAFELVWGIISASISFVWENIIKPIFEAIGTAWGLLWDGIKVVFDLIWGGIQTAFDLGKLAITTALDIIGSAFSTVWEGIKAVVTPIIDGIGSGIEKAVEIAKTALNVLKDAFTTVFGAIRDAVKGVWDGMVSLFKTVVNGVLGAIESAINWLIDRANDAIEYIPFVDYIDHVTLPRLEGGAGDNSSSSSSSSTGSGYAYRMASGGVVPGSSRGILANIAESGRTEAVLPLENPKTMAMLANAIMTHAGTNGSGSGITVNVYPSAQMSETEIASIVSRQLAFQLRKGAA